MGPMRRIALALGLLLPSVSTAQLPYRDPKVPVARRVADLLSRMSFEEKFWQLYMTPGDLDDRANDWSHGVFGLQVAPAATDSSARGHADRINAIQRYFVERTRLGIPIIPFEEAVHGLARPGATMFPAAIGLAATWDTALMGRVARAIARETRARGIRQVLSPVVNITRDPRWGRTEETYGEDQVLAGRMGAAYVRAFEQAGVVATPKHFVANVGEGGRDSWPIEASERQLREVYVPPFQAAFRAGAGSIMTAYNSVDGAPATQNRWLLTDMLRRLGFGGFIISDAAATGGATVLHLTEPDTPTAAAHAWASGLDVVFQSSWPQHRPYLDAIRRGLVPVATIDSAVARVLRAKFELGLFEQPYANADSAARWNGAPEHRALALEAARQSFVLLRNERRTLPLPRSIATLAVIGPDAVEARLGGYSAPGNRLVSILDALRARLSPARVRYAPGPGRTAALAEAVGAAAFSGLRGEYFANATLAGAPRFTRADSTVDFAWTLASPGDGLARDWYSVRWTGTLTVPAGRSRRLGVQGNDGYRLWLDGNLVLDRMSPRSSGLAFTEPLKAGRRHDLRLEYTERSGNGRIRAVWDVEDDWRSRIDSAVAVARTTDASVIVTGIEEGEFRDRASLRLPGHQEELIAAVAATGKPVVVVVVGGSAVTMPWLERAGAVLLAWYPGEAGGEVVAEALLGELNPAGRLPITFPVSEGQLPLYYNHKPTGRGDDYLDLSGLPLFPFGFGLSYTAFEYSDLSIAPDPVSPGSAVTIRARIRNAGDRAGDEVVQLYLHDEVASLARPVLQLAGFERLHLMPGESAEVVFAVGPGELRMLDERLDWVIEPGSWRVMVGASSRDIRLKGNFSVR